MDVPDIYIEPTVATFGDAVVVVRVHIDTRGLRAISVTVRLLDGTSDRTSERAIRSQAIDLSDDTWDGDKTLASRQQTIERHVSGEVFTFELPIGKLPPVGHAAFVRADLATVRPRRDQAATQTTRAQQPLAIRMPAVSRPPAVAMNVVMRREKSSLVLHVDDRLYRPGDVLTGRYALLNAAGQATPTGNRATKVLVTFDQVVSGVAQLPAPIHHETTLPQCEIASFSTAIPMDLRPTFVLGSARTTTRFGFQLESVDEPFLFAETLTIANYQGARKTEPVLANNALPHWATERIAEEATALGLELDPSGGLVGTFHGATLRVLQSGKQRTLTLQYPSLGLGLSVVRTRGWFAKLRHGACRVHVRDASSSGAAESVLRPVVAQFKSVVITDDTATLITPLEDGATDLALVAAKALANLLMTLPKRLPPPKCCSPLRFGFSGFAETHGGRFEPGAFRLLGLQVDGAEVDLHVTFNATATQMEGVRLVAHAAGRQLEEQHPSVEHPALLLPAMRQLVARLATDVGYR